MQHIRKITLHALGAMLITVGVAVAALVIVILSLEAQPIDVSVYAALRAVGAYGAFLAALAAIFAGCACVLFVVVMLIDGTRNRRRHGVR